MITLQIPLSETAAATFSNLANEHGLSVKRFLADRLDQIARTSSLDEVDAAFRKIVQESVARNRELLLQLEN